nr:methyltransferase domain-containing protein [Puniceicoccus vermicola]
MRTRFFRRFRSLPYHFENDAVILCAGARQGTEVEVLQDMGFSNAYGTDLNPGPENRWVRKGDFMKMDEEDSSVDLVFCNAIDHVLDIDLFLAEQTRVIRPGGYAMYEFIKNTKGGAFEAVEWESDGALLRKLLEYFEDVIIAEKEAHWRWILLKSPIKQDRAAEVRKVV